MIKSNLFRDYKPRYTTIEISFCDEKKNYISGLNGLYKKDQLKKYFNREVIMYKDVESVHVSRIVLKAHVEDYYDLVFVDERKLATKKS